MNFRSPVTTHTTAPRWKVKPAGLISPSSPRLGAILPTAEITEPANRSTAPAGSSIHVVARYAQGDSRHPVAQVSIFADDTLVAYHAIPASEGAGGFVAFQTVPFPVGTFQLTAVAFDASGTPGTSTKVTITTTGPITYRDPATGTIRTTDGAVPTALAPPASPVSYTILGGTTLSGALGYGPATTGGGTTGRTCTLPSNPRRGQTYQDGGGNSYTAVDPYFSTNADRVAWLAANPGCTAPDFANDALVQRTPAATCPVPSPSFSNQSDVTAWNVANPTCGPATLLAPTASTGLSTGAKWGIGIAAAAAAVGIGYVVLKPKSRSRRSSRTYE